MYFDFHLNLLSMSYGQLVSKKVYDLPFYITVYTVWALSLKWTNWTILRNDSLTVCVPGKSCPRQVRIWCGQFIDIHIYLKDDGIIVRDNIRWILYHHLWDIKWKLKFAAHLYIHGCLTYFRHFLLTVVGLSCTVCERDVIIFINLYQ